MKFYLYQFPNLFIRLVIPYQPHISLSCALPSPSCIIAFSHYHYSIPNALQLTHSNLLTYPLTSFSSSSSSISNIFKIKIFSHTLYRTILSFCSFFLLFSMRNNEVYSPPLCVSFPVQKRVFVGTFLKNRMCYLDQARWPPCAIRRVRLASIVLDLPPASCPRLQRMQVLSEVY
jgi:hypothetical protein